MANQVRVGVFDDAYVLIAEVKKAASELTGTDVQIGDLPANGTYRLQDGHFVPVGHGYGKPSAPPISADKALFLMLQAQNAGTPLPQECLDWMNWFERWGN